MAVEARNPMVYWAQNATNIFLKVDVHKVQKDSLHIEFNGKNVQFQTRAHGASGLYDYSFRLELYGTIDEKESGTCVRDNCVELCIRKNGEQWWPRLTAQVVRYPWLKIDFSRWRDEDGTTSEEETNNPSRDAIRQMLGDSKQPLSDFAGNFLGIEDAIKKAKEYRAWCRQSYLFLYNICLLLGHLLIVIELVHGYVTMGNKYYDHTWQRVAIKLQCCVIAQYFEFLHALVGFTKSNPLASLVQTGGRSIIIFVVLGGDARMHTKPMVFYVFLVYACIELFRYPYYALAVRGRDWWPVTWLRYSMWIPLYPMGFVLEGVIILRSIPYYVETQKYSIQMPNRTNFAFDFAIFEMIVLVFAFGPIMIYLIGHMRAQRKVKLRQQHVQKLKKRE